MVSAFNLPVGSGEVVIDTPDQATAFLKIADCFVEGCGFALATLNLDHIVKLGQDRAFLNAYRRHDIVVADGNPVVWLSQLAGQPVGLVPGSDLVVPLARLAARYSVPVALFGSTEVVLGHAADALRVRVPGLDVAAKITPSQEFDVDGAEADRMIEALRRSGARMVFLALGAPKQERFAVRARAALPEVGFVSIGAGLDFLAGQQRRAPAWLRRLALEWLWRMMSNPRRLAIRYARCAAILPGLAVRVMVRRLALSGQPESARPAIRVR